MGAKGIAILDFEGPPGSSYAEVIVTGQGSILADSAVEAFMMAESTADHNDVEHALVPIKLTCGDVVAGVGFTIRAVTEYRLTGTFKIRWVWA